LLREFIVLRCFKKVDFFSAPIPDDFKLLRSSLGSRFKAEYVQLNYGNVPQTFLPGSEKLTGKDILVGNSATPTNNHVEVFKLLSDLDLRGHKVIAPLSYGDERYRDAIIKLYRWMLTILSLHAVRWSL
jgi:dTDP-N-acetylfucosamine:lipid II N-acetylfucosaminyltransferase